MNIEKRLLTVRSHIAAETSHDLDAVSATFGISGKLSIPAEAVVVEGRDMIRAAHAGLFQGFPDLKLAPIRPSFPPAQTGRLTSYANRRTDVVDQRKRIILTPVVVIGCGNDSPRSSRLRWMRS